MIEFEDTSSNSHIRRLEEKLESIKYELEDEKMAHIRTKDGLAEEQRWTQQLQNRNSALTKEYLELFIKNRDENND